MASFVEQLRNNSVALISLVVAITALAYNTWRNEQSEENRNIRQAGIAMIQELAGLQQVVLFAGFGPEDGRGDPTLGWAHVLAIRDFSYAMPESVQANAAALHAAWEDNFEQITEPESAQYEIIDNQIDATKTEVLEAIGMLD